MGDEIGWKVLRPKKWIQSAHLRKYGTKDQGLEASKFPSRHFPILMDSQPLDYRVPWHDRAAQWMKTMATLTMVMVSDD